MVGIYSRDLINEMSAVCVCCVIACCVIACHANSLVPRPPLLFYSSIRFHNDTCTWKWKSMKIYLSNTND